MNRIAINTVGDELEIAAGFCRIEGIGLEVSAFAFPNNLDDSDIGVLVERHKNAVHGVSPVLSHGPFLDLVATSLDPSIVAVSKQRHQTSLSAAIDIGASVYIAHTNYTPMIRNPHTARTGPSGCWTSGCLSRTKPGNTASLFVLRTYGSRIPTSRQT